MKRSLSAMAITASAALVLSACGGSSSTPLTAADVEPKLSSAGIDCSETSSQPLEDGIGATAVTCALGESGGIVVIVADSADEVAKAKAELCATVTPDQGNLDLAYGDTWLSVTLSTAGIGAPQVADALGGQVATTTDYCA